MRAAREVTAEEMNVYRQALRERERLDEAALARRRKTAWEVARRAAGVLRAEFGATKVVVFGSLAREEGFSAWSDVDLAAWGIRREATFRAVAAVAYLSPEIPVNLVDVTACRADLLPVLEREGVEV